MNLKVNEQLAVLTAIQKAVKAKLDEVRAEADADMLVAFEDDGVTKKALKLGGVKVGDYIVVLASDDFIITDADAFNDFALTYGFANQKMSIKPECMEQAIKIIEEMDPFLLTEEVKPDSNWKKLLNNSAGTATYLDSGVPVSGVMVTGGGVKCTQVRGCKPEDVVPRIRELGGIDQLLLGEAD